MKGRGRPKLPDSDRMVGRCIWLKSRVWSEIEMLARCGNETESEIVRSLVERGLHSLREK
jgi:hypothetical protein